MTSIMATSARPGIACSIGGLHAPPHGGEDSRGDWDGLAQGAEIVLLTVKVSNQHATHVGAIKGMIISVSESSLPWSLVPPRPMRGQHEGLPPCFHGD